MQQALALRVLCVVGGVATALSIAVGAIWAIYTAVRQKSWKSMYDQQVALVNQWSDVVRVRDERIEDLQAKVDDLGCKLDKLTQENSMLHHDLAEMRDLNLWYQKHVLQMTSDLSAIRKSCSVNDCPVARSAGSHHPPGTGD